MATPIQLGLKTELAGAIIVSRRSIRAREQKLYRGLLALASVNVFFVSGVTAFLLLVYWT